MEQHKARAVQIRARAQWVEKGEKNTNNKKSVSKKVELMPRLWIALKLIMDKLLQIRVTYFTFKKITLLIYIKTKLAVKNFGRKNKQNYVKQKCSSPFRGTNAKL